jgi:hypothetical protein
LNYDCKEGHWHCVPPSEDHGIVAFQVAVTAWFRITQSIAKKHRRHRSAAEDYFEK